MHTSLIKLAIGVSTAGALLVPAMTVSAAGAPAQIYNSSLNIAATGNVASVGGEAYSFSEFGNEVELAGNHLGKVVVDLSSWGCQTGSWNNDNCGTVPGAKFNEPITFNIYASPPRGSNTPGALIATRTQTFAIPYRPSANFAHCTGAQAGEWWGLDAELVLQRQARRRHVQLSRDDPAQHRCGVRDRIQHHALRLRADW